MRTACRIAYDEDRCQDIHALLLHDVQSYVVHLAYKSTFTVVQGNEMLRHVTAAI